MNMYCKCFAVYNISEGLISCHNNLLQQRGHSIIYQENAKEATDLQILKKGINHLIYMDDIEIVAKNEKEWVILIQTIWMNRQDRESGIWDGRMYDAYNEIKEKRETMLGIKFPNQESIKSPREKENKR